MERRSFIKSTGTTGAGRLILPCGILAGKGANDTATNDYLRTEYLKEWVLNG
jgi:hypothetical protein